MLPPQNPHHFRAQGPPFNLQPKRDSPDQTTGPAKIIETSARRGRGGRFSPARGGRWPAVVPGPADLQGTVPHGRGNAVRFRVPPAPTKALSPLPWQGPSPLPQRSADPRPAGGQSPRPAPAPPPAGACLCRCGRHRSWWQRSARAGETRCLSGSRPEGQSPSPDREAFPGRRAGVVLFQHPVRGIRCAAPQPARPDNRDGSAGPQARS